MEEKQLTYGVDVNKGDICVYSSGGRYIIMVDEKGYCNQYIDTRGVFYKSSHASCSGVWVEATPEEKRWLQLCIAEDKTLSLDYVQAIMKAEAVPTINNQYSII